MVATLCREQPGFRSAVLKIANSGLNAQDRAIMDLDDGSLGLIDISSVIKPTKAYSGAYVEPPVNIAADASQTERPYRRVQATYRKSFPVLLVASGGFR
jgi:hypothetical protein